MRTITVQTAGVPRVHPSGHACIPWLTTVEAEELFACAQDWFPDELLR